MGSKDPGGNSWPGESSRPVRGRGFRKPPRAGRQWSHVGSQLRVWGRRGLCRCEKGICPSRRKEEGVLVLLVKAGARLNLSGREGSGEGSRPGALDGSQTSQALTGRGPTPPQDFTCFKAQHTPVNTKRIRGCSVSSQRQRTPPEKFAWAVQRQEEQAAPPESFRHSEIARGDFLHRDRSLAVLQASNLRSPSTGRNRHR